MKLNRFSIKKFIVFLLYVIVFMALTSPFYLFYGPFYNLKRGVVTTVNASRHKYLISYFLNQKEIDALVGTNTNTATAETEADTSNEDVSKVNVKYKNSSEITEYDIHSTNYDGYILEIQNPLRVKVAYTSRLGISGQKTSKMAKDREAIAAINGGSFKDSTGNGQQYNGTGAYPGGFVISQGKLIYQEQGVTANTKENVIAFDNTGHLIIGDHTLNELNSMNVKEAICFRPPTLLVNGKKQITDKGADGWNPRTAVGQKADGTVIFLVVDGRKLTKMGATLYDLQEIMVQHGAINAGVLDGGYSSTMYYDGELVNSPNAWDGERSVATALYVEP